MVADTRGNLKRLQSKDSRFSDIVLVIGDIRDREMVNRTMQGIDGVVHLATYTSVEKSLQNPEETWDINIMGMMIVLEACRKNNADFVFASSNAAAGEPSPPR